MVRAIQAQRASDCNAEVWNPFAAIAGTPPGGTTTDNGFSAACGITSATAPTSLLVGQTDVPNTLLLVGLSRSVWKHYVWRVCSGFCREHHG